jgi:iron complex outermembrane receptor protein
MQRISDRRSLVRRLIAMALLVAAPTTTLANPATPVDLARVSLEELMHIKITSAERKEERADEVSAAVFVITHDDIRRSGMTKLPELFRLVPGMQIAQINANEWAVAVRGFNNLYSDKLLVLIDGRSLYNRAFSGVFWDAQNMMVSDIDRIEVIRGPGGVTWGSNAVNGVINIITKSAADTKGTLVDVDAGTFERMSGAVRHGGSLGAVDYRVSTRWSDHGSGLTDANASADDGWRALTTAARVDWTRDTHSVMAQGLYMDTQTRPHFFAWPTLLDPPTHDSVSDVDEASGLVRWTRRGEGSVFQLQAFRTVANRNDEMFRTSERTTDADAQYQITLGRRHDVVAGGGFRRTSVAGQGSPGMQLPAMDLTTVYNGFVQDELSLSDRVRLTVGSKLEHDTFAGWGLLPSARVLWDVDGAQRVWGAVSRARRTPSAAYQWMELNVGVERGENGIPILIRLFGNPDYKSEELVAFESGYRRQLGPTASIDIAAFYGRYDNSTTVEPLGSAFEFAPQPHVLVALQFDNMLSVESEGVEVTGRWSPAPTWRLDGSYSTIHFVPRPDAASQDASVALFDGGAPRHQWQAHSTNQVSGRVQIDSALYYVGRLRQTNVPAYTRADARIEVTLTNQIALVGVGHNLFEPAHREFSDLNANLVGSRVPRSGRLQLRVRF